MNSESTRDPLGTRRWLLVAPALLVLWIVAQIDKTNVSLVIADKGFLSELHLAGHNTELGGLMSAFFAGYGIFIPVWGFLVDRFGPRICAITGSCAWGILLFLSSRAGHIDHYLAIRFFLGAAEGNLWPVCNALSNRWFPAREHSRIQAFWLSGTTLGTAVGVPLTAALMLDSGWRGALAELALISLLPMALFLFIGNRPPGSGRFSEARLSGADGDPQVTFRELLKTAPFWLITVTQAVVATSIYTLIQWLPSYLTAARHLSFAEMGRWITLGFVLAAVLTVFVGYVADRTMKRALTASVACMAFVVLVFPFARMFSPVMCAIALSTLTFVGSIGGALNGALLHAMVRPEAIARATGVYVGIGNFTSAAGPALFGYLISALGGAYWGGFLFLALVNVLGAACYFALHRLAVRSDITQANAARAQAVR
jgi:MFS family permease